MFWKRILNPSERHLCTGITKVIAWGKVKKEGDKNLLVASKIEKDEKK